MTKKITALLLVLVMTATMTVNVFAATTSTTSSNTSASTTTPKTVKIGDYMLVLKEGSYPAKVLVDGKTTGYNKDGSVNRDNFTELYRVAIYSDGSNDAGNCQWYAQARFQETTGIFVHTNDVNRIWKGDYNCEDLNYNISRKIDNIRSHSIVMVEKNSKDFVGHCLFIEYVERDANGKPINIWYTEANYNGDFKWDPGTDKYEGSLQSYGWEQFKEVELEGFVGYIQYDEAKAKALDKAA